MERHVYSHAIQQTISQAPLGAACQIAQACPDRSLPPGQ